MQVANIAMLLMKAQEGQAGLDEAKIALLLGHKLNVRASGLPAHVIGLQAAVNLGACSSLPPLSWPVCQQTMSDYRHQNSPQP